MKLDKTTISLAALAATIALVAVYFPRQSTEPAQLAETVSDSRRTTSAETGFDLRTSTGTLTGQEQALLAELQQGFSPEDLERVFNPPTFDERRQASYGDGTFDYLANASRDFDSDWSEFVDGLGLSPEDAQRVRDVWIETSARKTELGAILALEGPREDGAIGAAFAEVDNRFLSNLSEILSPEQLTAFFAHEEQLITDNFAFAEAGMEELLDTGYSGLISAAGDNDLPSVQAYLASGADPNRLTTDGRSAISEAITNGNSEMLRALIDAGGNANQTMPEGRSALKDAALFGNADVVQMLVDAGANPNHRRDPDNAFSVPLTTAARRGNTEMVRVLLDAGADATGSAGELALKNAIEFGDHEMERMLIEAGANANAPRVAESRVLINLGRRLGLIDD